MMHCLPLVHLAVLATTLLAAPAARAGALDNRSVIVLCWETADGAPVPRCGAETRFVDVLRREGGLLVDAAQAERVRATLDPAKLSTPEGLRGVGVDLLDAELAVVVRVDASKLGGVGKLQQWGARISLQVIDVPRARILATLDDEAQANATASSEGARNAIDVWLTKGGGALKVRQALLDAAAAPTDVEVWVFDVPGLEEAAAIERVIEASGTATSWKRTAMLKGTAKWRVVLAPASTGGRRDPDALPRALATSDVGLVVQSATGGLLQLAWNPAARVRLRALLDVTPHRGAPPWYRAAALDLAAAQALDTGFIEPTRDAAQPHDVVLAVTTTSGKPSRVTAAIKKPGAPAIVTTSESGPAASIDETQRRAIAKAGEQFRAWLVKNPTAFSQWERLKRAPPQLEVQLELLTPRDDSGAGVLRSADLPALASTGLVRAKVETRLDDLRARARIVPAGRAPAAAATSTAGTDKAPAPQWASWVHSVDDPAAGGSDAGPPWSAWSRGGASGSDVLVRLVDETAAPLPLASVARDGIASPFAARLEVQVEGRIGERAYRRTTSTALLVHPPNTVDFRRLETFAAVVDAAAPWSADVAAGADVHALAITPELGRAARVLAGLGSHHVDFVVDADAPYGAVEVDAVKPPQQTLADGNGDRDALAALWLSALASERLETRLVRVGGALLVAFFPGLPLDAWPLLAPTEKGTLVIDGRRFAVVDPTTPGSDAYAAMRRGAAALSTSRAKPEVVALQGRGAGALGGPAVSTNGAAKQDAKTRVLVWDVVPATPADAAIAAGALEEVARALGANAALQVLSRREVKALISIDAERRLLGCDEPKCFVDVAQAVSARYVVTGSLAREQVGGAERPVLALSLLDTVESKGVSRQRASTDDGSLTAAAGRAALRAAAPLFAKGAPPDVGWRVHVDELVHFAKDPRARVRLLALAGDLDEARTETSRIADSTLRRRYQDNVIALQRGTEQRTDGRDVVQMYFTKEW